MTLHDGRMPPRGPALFAADALPCGLIALRDDGRVLAVNATLAHWLDRAAVQMVGQPVDRLLTPASAQVFHGALMPLLRMQGQAEELTLDLCDVDGAPFTVQVSASLQRGADADDPSVVRCVLTPPGLQGAPAVAGEALPTGTALPPPAPPPVLAGPGGAHRTARQLPGVMFQLRRDAAGWYSVPYASEAVAALYGVDAVALREDPRRLIAAIDPEDLSRMREGLQASAETLGDWRSVHRSLAGEAPGEPRWMEAHAVPERLEDGSVLWHGYAADITERRRMEAALRDKESAEQASQAKSAFLARLSHELRTPLNSILGFSRLLELELRARLTEDQRRKLRLVEGAGRELMRLLDEVLDLTRLEAGRLDLHPEDVALAPLLRRAQRQLEGALRERRVRLLSQGDATLAVHADRARLQQVLTHLLSHAVAASPVEGTVLVEVRAQGDEVRVDVIDEGAGLEEWQIARLFEPFGHVGGAPEAEAGTSLGLVVTQGLIRAMGGRLQVHSVPGQGSCFGLQLPRVPDVAAVADTVPGSLPMPLETVSAGPPRTVLYVEDNPVNTLLMESIFALRPAWRLEVVASAADAIDAVRRELPDLLLLDLHLPDAHGLDLLEAIRDEPGLALVPAVAVSADALPDDVAQARAGGFNDYWVKPLDVDRTLRALDALLAPADGTAPPRPSRPGGGGLLATPAGGPGAAPRPDPAPPTPAPGGPRQGGTSTGGDGGGDGGPARAGMPAGGFALPPPAWRSGTLTRPDLNLDEDPEGRGPSPRPRGGLA